ncbi:MAG TPA: hypothetical protein VNR66_16895 [Solirubrobacteraceae bacterium]|nr:hypothetical protein [Solirubrobacteraceae bacterium]
MRIRARGRFARYGRSIATRPRILLAASVAVGVLSLAAAGCGSSSSAPSAEQQVKQVLHNYLSAQASGDGQTACALLTPTAQSQLVGAVVKAGKGLLSATTSCSDAVGLVRAVAGAQVLAALKAAKIGQVQVHGSSATAEVTGGTVFGRQQVRLVKSSTWMIDGVPGLAG